MPVAGDAPCSRCVEEYDRVLREPKYHPFKVVVDEDTVRNAMMHRCPKDGGGGCGTNRGCGSCCPFETEHELDYNCPGSVENDGLKGKPKVWKWRIRNVEPRGANVPSCRHRGRKTRRPARYLVDKFGRAAFDEVFVPTLQERFDYNLMSGAYPDVMPWNKAKNRKATLTECCQEIVTEALRLKDAVAEKDAALAAKDAEIAALRFALAPDPGYY